MCIWLDWYPAPWYQTLKGIDKVRSNSYKIWSVNIYTVFWKQTAGVAPVDDFCFTGSEIFQTRVINRLLHVLAVESEVVEYQYIRLDIKRIGKILDLDRMNM